GVGDLEIGNCKGGQAGGLQGGFGEDEVDIVRGHDAITAAALTVHGAGPGPAADIERIVASTAGQVGDFDGIVENDRAAAGTVQLSVAEREVDAGRDRDLVIASVPGIVGKGAGGYGQAEIAGLDD